MPKTSIKHIAEVIGVVTVTVSLLFVGMEIRQANTIAKVTTEYEIRNNFSNLNEILMIDEELAQLLIKTRDSNTDNLTTQDRVMLGSWARRILNGWLAVEQAYENGMLSEETYSGVFDDIRNELSLAPGFRPVMISVVDIYQGQADTGVLSHIIEVLDEYGAVSIPL